MINIQCFTFNAFQEHTYILSDETKECVIIDPGCYNVEEQKTLTNFIKEEDLHPVKLLNTHCHIDHVLGNNFVAATYNIGLEIHEKDLPTLNATPEYGHLYGFNIEQPIQPSHFLKDKEIINFGNSALEVRFVPGHCAGHIVLINHKNKFVINGDVLFRGSIGRTDLPGGDYNTLINNIKEELFSLTDDYTVYCGHGEKTTIGFEKDNNPFIN